MRVRILAFVAAMSLVAACGTRVTGSETVGAGRTAAASATSANDSSSDANNTAAVDTGPTQVAGATASRDGRTGAAAAPSGPSDPGVTDTEIRIGASGPLSGVAGFLGEEAFGAIDSYFQLINAQGGING